MADANVTFEVVEETERFFIWSIHLAAIDTAGATVVCVEMIGWWGGRSGVPFVVTPLIVVTESCPLCLCKSNVMARTKTNQSMICIYLNGRWRFGWESLSRECCSVTQIVFLLVMNWSSEDLLVLLEEKIPNTAIFLHSPTRHIFIEICIVCIIVVYPNEKNNRVCFCWSTTNFAAWLSLKGSGE